MTPQKPLKKHIAEDYVKRYRGWAALPLAKLMHEENKGVWPNLDAARHAIRRVTGSAGNDARGQATIPKPLTHNTANWKPFKEVVNTSAKVLVFDIETAPIRAYVWGIWNQNIALNQIQSDWFCLTWSAKWLFEDKVYSAKLTPKEVLKQDDSRIIESLWQLLNQADIVIAHNADKFDIPRINSRFITHKLPPPLPYQVIDTLKHIRRQFGFTSNKLDYVNKLLNLERKSETGGFELWERCLQGDKEALAKMEEYNVQDVRILEETYLRIRPWIKPHPNMGLHILDGHERCPSCGSADLEEQGKPYRTSVGVFPVFRCKCCGATGRKRVSEVKLAQKKNLLTPVAK